MATEIKIFFTYCGADQSLKDMAHKAILPLVEKYMTQNVQLTLIAMDEKCVDRWDLWSKDNAIGCDIMIPIITENSFEVLDGKEKVMLAEIALGVEHRKRLVPVAFCPLRGKTREQLYYISTIYASEQGLDEACVSLAEKVDLLIASEAERKSELEKLKPLTKAYSNANFVGREGDLAWIKNALDKSNIAVLMGEGGIGKTTLAEEFFKMNSSEYIGAFVVKAPEGIKNCITALPFADVKLSPDERYAKNKRVLEELNQKTIIIFDNCDIELTEKEILEELAGIKCKAIITSRDGLSEEGEIPILNVERMSDTDLLALVRKHYPRIDKDNKLTTEMADALLCELFEYVDGHTLTVEMASAIMRDGEIPIPRVKDKLLECKEKIITQRLSKRQSVLEHLGALYDFASLEPDEKRVLNALCLISPLVGIERKEIRELLELDSNNEINSLARKTFLRYNEEKRSASMHPLFADVYYKRESVHTTEEYQKTAEYIAELESDVADLKKNEQTLLSCLFFAEKRADNLEDKVLLGKMYDTIGSCFGAISRFIEAIDYKEKAVALFEQSEDVDVIATGYNNLGKALIDNCNTLKGLEYVKKALKMEFEKPKEIWDYQYISTGYDNIGCAHSMLGEFNEALENQQKALDIRLEIYKDTPNHPGIATSYNNIGLTYCSLGDCKKALEKCNEALEIYCKAYENAPYHPDIANTYNSIGAIYGAMGEGYEEIKYYKKALEIYCEIYKETPNHFAIATVHNNIGAAYGEEGNPQEAKKHIEMALEILTNIFDAQETSYIAETHKNLANVWLEQRNFDEAEKHYKRAIEIFSKSCDRKSRENLADSYSGMSFLLASKKPPKYAEAIDTALLCADILEKLGVFNHKLKITYENLYEFYRTCRDKTRAEIYRKKAKRLEEQE